MQLLRTDEDFDGQLTSAPLTRVPGLDLVRVQDVGLMHAPDPDILAWAASQGRIVLTHDRNTMTGFASTRVNAGQPMPGLFVVDRQASLGQVLNGLDWHFENDPDQLSAMQPILTRLRNAGIAVTHGPTAPSQRQRSPRARSPGADLAGPGRGHREGRSSMGKLLRKKGLVK